jgi:PAS domain S-box-containing protein
MYAMPFHREWVREQLTHATDTAESQSEALLGRIIGNAAAAVYIKDTNGKYVYVNWHFEVMTGISSDEALGHTDFDLFPIAVASTYRENDVQTLERMSGLWFEEPAVIHGSGRLFSTVKVPALEQERVAGVWSISVEVTSEARVDSVAAPERPMSEVYFARLLASLTPQEDRVLDLVVAGLTDKEIAERLTLSNDTVRHHVSHLLRKLRKRRAQVIIEMLKRDRG